jgi:hypothetical protein
MSALNSTKNHVSPRLVVGLQKPISMPKCGGGGDEVVGVIGAQCSEVDKLR